MILFIISCFAGWIGMTVGLATGKNEFFAIIGAIVGFLLPFAIVLEKIYKDLRFSRNSIKADENCIGRLSETVCPACGSRISPEDQKCIICGIPLVVEMQG